MRVLEPFFNNNFDDSYTRLKNKAKEVLALMVQTASTTGHTVLFRPYLDTSSLSSSLQLFPLPYHYLMLRMFPRRNSIHNARTN